MKLFYITILVLLFISCDFKFMDDSIDLGNNYRFIQDYPQAIIYHSTEEYKGIGINIVPPNVIEYDFNDEYIIAKSISNDSIINYWIINKQNNETKVKPLDSIAFYEFLNDKEILLKLDDK